MAELYSAAYYGDCNAIKKQLKRKADVKWKHPHGGATATYVAAEFNHPHALKILLDAGAPVDEPRADGATPLYKACQSKDRLDVAKILIQAKANVNQTDPTGVTPLWMAIHHDLAELVELLLDNGADPAKQVRGWRPIDLARKENRTKCTALLEKRLPKASAQQQQQQQGAEGVTPEQNKLYGCAQTGNVAALRALLAEVNSPQALINNVPKQASSSALFEAASRGHVDLVKLLLDNGAVLSAGHRYGHTPLATACANGHVDVVSVLLGAGASPDCTSADGSTPLAAAAYSGKTEVVKLLLSYGVDTDGTWPLPLALAAAQGHAACVRLMIEAGAKLDADFEGLTALGWAEKRGRTACAKLLRKVSSKSDGADADEPAESAGATTALAGEKDTQPTEAVKDTPPARAAVATKAELATVGGGDTDNGTSVATPSPGNAEEATLDDDSTDEEADDEEAEGKREVRSFAVNEAKHKADSWRTYMDLAGFSAVAVVFSMLVMLVVRYGEARSRTFADDGSESTASAGA